MLWTPLQYPETQVREVSDSRENLTVRRQLDRLEYLKHKVLNNVSPKEMIEQTRISGTGKTIKSLVSRQQIELDQLDARIEMLSKEL